MRTAAMLVDQCDCVVPQHETRCLGSLITAERGKLYDGLYDARNRGKRVAQVLKFVKLLNPGYEDEDPVVRRFALLEID